MLQRPLQIIWFILAVGEENTSFFLIDKVCFFLKDFSKQWSVSQTAHNSEPIIYYLLPPN